MLLLTLVSCREPSPARSPTAPDPSSASVPATTPGSLPDRDRDGVADPRDCDPDDPTVYPGAPDICGDDRVTDCDRVDDEQLVTVDGVASFTDLQLALDAAGPGSSVLVCPGRYIGSFVAAAPVQLASHGGSDVVLLEAPADPGIIEYTVLTVPGDSTIEGLTISGGDSADGGGLLVDTAGALTVADSVITGNRAVTGGGVALIGGVDATFVNTTISGNTAEEGGGLYAGPGSVVDLGDSIVELNAAVLRGAGVELMDAELLGGIVQDNVANGGIVFAYYSGYGGGGVAAIGDTAVTGTEIRRNVSEEMGAGFLVEAGTSVFTDVSIHDNDGDTAFGGGGAVSIGDLTLAGATEIVGNHADIAGGVFVYEGVVRGGRIADNQSAMSAGGVFLWDSDLHDVVIEANITGNTGGGISPHGHCAIYGGSIVRNESSYYGGGIGAYFLALENSLTIEGTVLTDNVAVIGGAFRNWSFETTLTSATVLRNVATETGGGVWAGAALEEMPWSLTSIDTDWGDGANDNVPEDVYAFDLASGWEFGAAASFTCDAAGCQ